MLKIENSHIVVNNEIIVIVIQQMSPWNILMCSLVKTKVHLRCGKDNQKANEEDLKRMNFEMNHSFESYI